MSYESAAAARQSILDYLNSAPEPAIAIDIRNSTGITRNVFQGCVKIMVELREMEKVGKGSTVRYRAKSKKTISADDMQKRVEEQRNKSINEGKLANESSKPGHYRQIGGNWPANSRASGGGQGSGRQRVYVGSTAGMV